MGFTEYTFYTTNTLLHIIEKEMFTIEDDYRL